MRFICSPTVTKTCTVYHVYKSIQRNPKKLLLIPIAFSSVTRTTGHFKLSPSTLCSYLEFILLVLCLHRVCSLSQTHTKVCLLNSLEKTFWFSQQTNTSLLIKANHKSSPFLCQCIKEEGERYLCGRRPSGRLVGSNTESGPLIGSQGS